jgi:hypothetical protein
MDTYASEYNRRVNHTMLALHCYLSWSFVGSVILTAAQLAAFSFCQVMTTLQVCVYSPHLGNLLLWRSTLPVGHG